MSEDDLTIEPGTNVEDVVSFKLAPQFNDNNELEAVCVTDLQSAENIVFDNNNGNSNNDGSSSSNDDGSSSSNDDGSSSSNDDGSSSSNDDGDNSVATQGIGQSQSTDQ